MSHRLSLCAGLALSALSCSPVLAQNAPVDLTPPLAAAPTAAVITAAVPGQLGNAAAIAPFLARLAPNAPASATGAGVLSIVQIGDSHTAGDMVSQGLRAALQARLGNAGRGMMPAGKPYQGYLSWGATARQSAEWQGNSLFGPQRHADGALLGFSGFTQTTTMPAATMTLSADMPATRFTRFTLCGLTSPDAGAVTITFDGVPAEPISFSAHTPGAACFVRTSPTPVTQAMVATLDTRTVSLTAWETRTGTPGAIVANLGVVGARAMHLARADDAVAGAELAAARPDLVILAFGTNEGFDPALGLAETEAVVRTAVARVRAMAGANVPILLVGPPDAASNRPAVALPALPETQVCGGGWSVPGHLAQMRALERRLATTLGLAFWDWQGAMGGPCTTMAWVAQGLQRGDHVHFTREGGRLIGAGLAADLFAAAASLPPARLPPVR
ncbi:MULTISPECIES: GDSL-type esterase/lipase family protein [unclassified Novosphingobium]|uniref:GDSL-type esterase/lipase family protein n=1 Tax=unclassified Novosphingobium TaxID=2644732 RepID=UPI00146F205F|nr:MULTISPECIES: GDSL-type esterase/lipase family protein [unclassified Novosphingobium]NMN05728.1 lysophospholipase L1-like esterase [Novosphingobium sp. SG919]NMN87912.1 lysophospholipase L1-like esterase [Novosphingobium sp. SG916]